MGTQPGGCGSRHAMNSIPYCTVQSAKRGLCCVGAARRLVAIACSHLRALTGRTPAPGLYGEHSREYLEYPVWFLPGLQGELFQILEDDQRLDEPEVRRA